jgi:predicted RNA-binding protein YlqC (UPF0109 family)
MSDASGASPFSEPDFSGLEQEAAENEETDSTIEEPDSAEDLQPDEADGNRAPGSMTEAARQVLVHVARSIVDDPDSVAVDVEQERGQVRLNLHVAPADMGRIIGRRGRTAQAVRTLVRAAGASEGHAVFVDIVD